MPQTLDLLGACFFIAHGYSKHSRAWASAGARHKARRPLGLASLIARITRANANSEVAAGATQHDCAGCPCNRAAQQQRGKRDRAPAGQAAPAEARALRRGLAVSEINKPLAHKWSQKLKTKAPQSQAVPDAGFFIAHGCSKHWRAWASAGARHKARRPLGHASLVARLPWVDTGSERAAGATRHHRAVCPCLRVA